jgi:hypothetical protein
MDGMNEAPANTAHQSGQRRVKRRVIEHIADVHGMRALQLTKPLIMRFWAGVKRA